jgi:hypothetical protein
MTSSSTSAGGLPRRFGTAVVSTSTTTTAAFLAARFGGAVSVLDGPATALDRVARARGFSFVGSGSSEASGSGPVFAARLVVRTVARGLGGGFAGVTGPSDRSLRREGSDGRGSVGAFRLGAIVE